MRLNSRSSIVDRPSSIVVLTALLMAPLVCSAQYSFEEVASGLKHPDPATRIRAIRILKEADYQDAAVPIAATLDDPDVRVQLEAIDAVRALFMARPVARRRMIGFVIEVRSQGPDSQTFVSEQISLLPRRVPPEVLRGLAAAMRAADPRTRLDAIHLFGMLAFLAGPAAQSGPSGNETAVAIRGGIAWTLEALRRGDPPTRIAAAVAAGRALRNCGQTPDPSATLCAELGNVLIDSINGREPLLRRAAMQALGHLRYRQATQALADQLSYYQRGPDAAAALEGLAGIGHQSSAPIFRRQLTGSNADMRRLAVEGLARAGEKDDLAELDRMGQNERSNGVLLALHYAAIRLGAASGRPDQLAASLADNSLQPLALQYLLDLSPSIGSALVGRLKDRDPDTRRLIADVLGFSADPTVIPNLEAARKDPDADVALAAQRAIDRIGLAGADQDAPSR
jgi:HEAT repeat protein